MKQIEYPELLWYFGPFCWLDRKYWGLIPLGNDRTIKITPLIGRFHFAKVVRENLIINGHVTTGGYVKTLEYKEAWREWWDKQPQEIRQRLLDPPNFDPDIFEEITGIRVERDR